MSKLEPQLIELMTKNKALRASDRLLMIEVWRTQGLHLTAEQEQAFMKVTSPESIRRTRQKIQERGVCKPDVWTIQARKQKAQAVKEHIRAEKAPIVQSAFFMDDERKEERPDPFTFR